MKKNCYGCGDPRPGILVALMIALVACLAWLAAYTYWPQCIPTPFFLGVFLIQEMSRHNPAQVFATTDLDIAVPIHTYPGEEVRNVINIWGSDQIRTRGRTFRNIHILVLCFFSVFNIMLNFFSVKN